MALAPGRVLASSSFDVVGVRAGVGPRLPLVASALRAGVLFG